MEMEPPNQKPALAKHFTDDIRKDIQNVYDRIQTSLGKMTLADVVEDK
jgi:hypothetical protein